MEDGTLSDVGLARSVAATVSEPRRDRADSFVLHAPLELLARLALLPQVRPANRERARSRIVDIAAKLDAFGPAVDPPPAATFASTEAAATRLADAVERGEAADADASAAWLATRASPVELAELLGDAVVARLSAAGHAPIFLAHWPRVSPRGEVTGTLLRPLARSLAEEPDVRIAWVDKPFDQAPTSDGPAPSMFEALAAGPRLGAPDVEFIAPIMTRVDVDATTGALRAALAPTVGDRVAWRSAANDVQRAAAWSMLLEPGKHSPYLWSHCLTMPQAVLATAAHAQRPERHLAVAATHVVGFRSAFAAHDLVARFDQPAPGLPLGNALDAGQLLAAAAAWHTPVADRPALVDELVNRAAVHEDAHLVKYTLACLDASTADPEATRLYLAASASLAGWWAEQPA